MNRVISFGIPLVIAGLINGVGFYSGWKAREHVDKEFIAYLEGQKKYLSFANSTLMAYGGHKKIFEGDEFAKFLAERVKIMPVVEVEGEVEDEVNIKKEQ